MKYILLFVLFTTLSLSVNAQVSAVRKPDQNYLDVASSVLKTRSLKKQFIRYDSAYSVRSEAPDLSKVAVWANGDINKAFEAIRDERFMKDDENFSRRPTWMYPYDGCFARAEVAAQRLIQKGFPSPSKIFIFGNLLVKSKNASEAVSWWYHVAAAYRQNNIVYIFDPAIEPKKLLTLEGWKKTMGPDTKELSICSGGAFDPDSDCETSLRMSYQQAQEQQGYYFEAETNNLLDLGRDPAVELGDNPPWKN